MSILKAILNSIYLTSNNFCPHENSNSQDGKKKKANTGDCPGSINHFLPAESMSQMIEKNEAKNEDTTEETKWSQEW